MELLENELKSKLERKLALLNQPKDGEAYVDFTYPNTEGEEVSLSSFMGRLVYVDVWATWWRPAPRRGRGPAPPWALAPAARGLMSDCTLCANATGELRMCLPRQDSSVQRAHDRGGYGRHPDWAPGTSFSLREKRARALADSPTFPDEYPFRSAQLGGRADAPGSTDVDARVAGRESRRWMTTPPSKSKATSSFLSLQ